MYDVMIDLETLGTIPGCAIVSVGAIPFDEFGVDDERTFYRAIMIPEWDTPGLTPDGLHKQPDTIDWWKIQSEQARQVFTQPTRHTTRSALSELSLYLNGMGSPRIWGNGADFDNPIVAVAAHRVGLDPKEIWRGYNGRCYRTVKQQFRDVKLRREGVHHNALDDARAQALHMVEICKTRGWKLM